MNSNPYAMYANIGNDANLNPQDIPLPTGEPPQQQFTLTFTPQQLNQPQQSYQQQPSHLPYQQYGQSNEQQQHQQSAPIFGSASKPLSFEELAAKQTENVMSNTLQQYGPAFSMPSPMRPSSPYMHQQASSNLMFATSSNNNSTMHHTAPRFTATVPQVPVYQLPLQQTSGPLIINRPALIRPQNSFQQQSTHATNNSMTVNNASNVNMATPEAPISPPLDSLNSASQNAHKPTVQNNNGNNSLAVVPQGAKVTDREKVQNQLNDMKDKTKSYGLNDVLACIRDLDLQYQQAQKQRATHERELNDAIRKAHGKTLDLDPNFIRKKAILDMQDMICKDLNEGINDLRAQLKNRFNYTMGSIKPPTAPAFNQPLQKRQPRAKMSTAAPTFSKAIEQPDKVEDKRCTFDLKDGNLWCKDCDLHYTELKDFCDHLHKREHSLRAKKPIQPPWRTTLEPLNRKRSYDTYKSICARLSNKIKSTFTVYDIDAAINPSLQNTEALKNLNLSRERGNLTDDDLLFHLKGYQFLVPINGYYCNLCNRALCDFQEAEQHLKSYFHLAEHAKAIALDPVREKKFREELEKSKKTQQKSQSDRERERDIDRSREREKERERERERAREADRDRDIRRERERPKVAVVVQPARPTQQEPTPSTSRDRDDPSPPLQQASRGGLSQYSARLPYKKPTSHIVDEHETISDKFDKRGDKNEQDVASKSDRLPKSKALPEKRPKRAIPEIVSVAQNRPSGALKKLKSTRLFEPSNRRKDDDNDAEKDGDKDGDIDVDDDDDDVHILDAIRSIENSSPDEPPLPVVDANNNGNQNDDSDIVELISEYHLSPDDPDSPFPGLDLKLTGNLHTEVLKDKRLAQEASVLLNRLDLQEYKEMLLEGSSLWDRVSKVMTKKEPGQYEKDLEKVTEAEPTYFQPDGQDVPVDLESDVGEDFKMEHMVNFFCEP